MSDYIIRNLTKPEDMIDVEELQRLVWPGVETDVVPVHILVPMVDHGGLVIGAFDVDDPSKIIGFVFGFPGHAQTPAGPIPIHCSQMAGVHPEYRNMGLGYALKRAQWQMVRQQGLGRITWTYDPLQSRNANLNLSKLGVVCNTYVRNYYGEMRDGLNIGLPSDRFKVDWWVNSRRVEQRLNRTPRTRLDLAHHLAAGATIVNPTELDEDGWPRPTSSLSLEEHNAPLLLVEIPPDFLALKAASSDLALSWKLHSREIFESMFARGYLVTDFIFMPGTLPRSFYVLSDGRSTF
jgi:predicted GNAT superfamily acetyltransferase